MNKKHGTALPLHATALGLAGLLLAAPAAAQTGPEGYAADVQGNIVRDIQGDCVITSDWTEDKAIEACHPEIVAARQPAEPAEQPEQVAMAPVRQRISLDADTYFEFDRAELTQAGRDRLDQIAEAAAAAEEPSIQIVGYADPIGPEEYNLELSEQRAEAVKAYLVERGVRQDAVQTAAQGEIDIVPQCEGMSGTELIQCLAPNRRADIEFAGFEIVERPVEQPGATPGTTEPATAPR